MSLNIFGLHHLDLTNFDLWIYYDAGPIQSIYQLLNGRPFYKYYEGIPFWSGEYLWFVWTR